MQVPEEPQPLFLPIEEFADPDDLNFEVIGNNYPYTINLKENLNFGWDESKYILTIPLSTTTYQAFNEACSHLRMEYEPEVPNDYCSLRIDFNDPYIDINVSSTDEGSPSNHATGTWSGAMKLYYDDELLVTINCPQITVE